MKKTLQASMIFTILALICGVFYREFTKFLNFQGTTALAFTHVHFFVLGTLLFLILTLFCILTPLEKEKQFQRFIVLYSISLPFMVLMMLIRGVIQVQGVVLSSSIDAMISGIAGISHIMVGSCFLLLFLALKNAVAQVQK